jgi:hypothetical protein
MAKWRNGEMVKMVIMPFVLRLLFAKIDIFTVFLDFTISPFHHLTILFFTTFA